MNFWMKFNFDLNSRSHLKSIAAQFPLPLDFHQISNRILDLTCRITKSSQNRFHMSRDKTDVSRSLIGSKSSWIIGSDVDIIAVQEVRVLGGHLMFRQSDSIEQIQNYNFIKIEHNKGPKVGGLGHELNGHRPSDIGPMSRQRSKPRKK